MSILPSELLHLICEFAWNHDSPNSLPLVSRQFHDITLPLRYRCITVTNWNTDSPRLSKIPHDLPVFHRVRNLFVSGVSPSTSEWTNVLKHVASNLETLCVDIRATALLACVYRVDFPCLQELTLNGFYSYPTTLKMPALKRLHLAGQRNPFGLMKAGIWGGLDVLRISGVSATPTFAEEIKETLEEDPSSASLARLIVQLGPEIPSRRGSEELMVEMLRELQQRPRGSADAEIIVIEDRLKFSAMETAHVRRLWKDGIDGLDAGWKREHDAIY